MAETDAVGGACRGRVLVTRPAEDAAPLNRALRDRGFRPVAAPLLEIVPLPRQDLDLTGIQALLFTSANGVRSFAAQQTRRDLPVFAVGDASARAARDAGFQRVESAGGDVDDLARLVTARLRPAAGALLHPAASRLAGDLQGSLRAAGFELRRAVLYEARTLAALPAALSAELAAAPPDFAVFFSPRTAETFVTLVLAARLRQGFTACRAVCLSEAVARRLRDLDWAAVAVAPAPTQEALLATLEEIAGPRHDT